MAHFAQLDENNIVINVIVVSNEDTADENGNEVESVGIAFCQSLFGEDTLWVQTSFNARMRRRFGGIGDMYDPVRNVFRTRSPYPSWTLRESDLQWIPPTQPEGGDTDYGHNEWDEDSLSWIRH